MYIDLAAHEDSVIVVMDKEQPTEEGGGEKEDNNASHVRAHMDRGSTHHGQGSTTPRIARPASRINSFWSTSSYSNGSGVTGPSFTTVMTDPANRALINRLMRLIIFMSVVWSIICLIDIINLVRFFTYQRVPFFLVVTRMNLVR